MDDAPGMDDAFEKRLATFAACLKQFVETLSCWGTEADREGLGDDRSPFADVPIHFLNRALVRDALNLDDARWNVRPHLGRMDDHQRVGLLWSEKLSFRIFDRWGLTQHRHVADSAGVTGSRWTVPGDEDGVNAIHYGPALAVRDDELRALEAALKLSLMQDHPKVTAPPYEPLVSLDQAATLVGVTKETLARYKGKGLPEPTIKGGHGRSARYRWSEMRVFLQIWRADLPEIFPGSPENLTDI